MSNINVLILTLLRRELKRRRKEAAGKRKRNWELGDGCRVVYENDGLEYEATIVKITSRYLLHWLG